jgi:two-component system, cell cycle response regulator
MGVASGNPNELDALRAQVAHLQERLAALEAERDEYAQQVEELFVLQQVFSTLSSSLDLTDILSTVLRGAVEALMFGRVILFDVLDSGEILRRLECGRERGVESAADEHGYRADSALQSLARGETQLAFGSAEDDDAPLDDTRGFFCAAPLLARGALRGILYADDPPGNEIGENQLRMLIDFATQAAIAMENARLYEEARRLLEETQRLALTDTLTGISNRRALHELFEHELRSAERYGTPLAFAILDLDELKQLNDTGGHHAGDAALRRFAEALTRNARRGDIVARYAGDEFVLVMLRTDREAAAKGIERIMAALRDCAVPASIGIAMYPQDGTDAQSLFFAADEALYAAKLSGKNCYRFYRNPDTSLDIAK